MTKIKNTKKGMAKKTLSISLAVAMLATSNVPVWAAEDLFTDGEVAVEAFDAEEVVVDTEDAVDAQAPQSIYSAEFVGFDADFQWGISKDVKVKITDPLTGDNITKDMKFRFLQGGKETDIAGYKEQSFEAYYDAETGYATIPLRFDSASVGQKCQMQVFENINYDWDAKSGEITVGTQVLTGTATFDKSEPLRYTGSQITKVPAHINLAFTNDEGVSVTLAEGSFDFSTSELSGKDTINSWNKTEEELTAKFNIINNKLYTGTVTVDGVEIWRKPVADLNTVVKAELPAYTYEYRGKDKVVKGKDIVVTNKLVPEVVADAAKDFTIETSKLGEKSARVQLDMTDKEGTLVNFSTDEDKDFDDNSSVLSRKPRVNPAETVKVVARDLSNTTNTKIAITTVTEDTLGRRENGDRYIAANALKKHLVCKDADGETLALNNDVVITFNGEDTLTLDPNKSEYTATVKAVTENVTNSRDIKFSVVEHNLNEAIFDKETENHNWPNGPIHAVEYTGEKITFGLTADNFINKLGELRHPSVTLIPGKSFDKNITFGENTSAALDGHIYVKGLREFAGSQKDVEFAINKRSLNVNEAKIVVPEKVLYNSENRDYVEGYNVASSLITEFKDMDVNTGKEKAYKLTVPATDYEVKQEFVDKNKNTLAKGEKGNVVGNYIKTTITFKGGNNSNFKLGTATGTFTDYTEIVNKAIAEADVQLLKTEYTYTGKEITPEYKVVVDGEILVKDRDYTQHITRGVNVGEATLTITGMGDYDKTSVSKKFTIVAANVKDLKVTAKLNGTTPTIVYDGTQHVTDGTTTNLEVTLNGFELTGELKDQLDFVYPTSKLANINAGNGTVTLKPVRNNKNFVGETEFTFTISPYVLKNAGDIVVYNAKGSIVDLNTFAFDYDGTAHKFADEDYKLSFAANSKMKITENDYEIVYRDDVFGKDTTALNPEGWDDYATRYGSILVIAKGNYVGADTYECANKDKVESVAKAVPFMINSKDIQWAEAVIENGAYAEGKNVEPVVKVTYNGKTLVKDVDYTLAFDKDEDRTKVTNGKTLSVRITGINGYYGYVSNRANDNGWFNWGIDKFDFANAEVVVSGTDAAPVVKVLNSGIVVDPKNYDLVVADGEATITATKDNKNYTGTKTVEIKHELDKPATPMLEKVVVNGNKATAILSGEAEGAMGYDFVISKDKDCTTNKDYDQISKNILKTTTDFTYVQQGTYYAYCHAWTRDDNGKKVFSEWSNMVPFYVGAITPETPVITSVVRKGSTVTVTYENAEAADGYDVVLGSAVKTVAGEKRPVNYGTLVKKNQTKTTVVFKNVPAGTYYVGMHAYNRTNPENNTKVFSPWANYSKKVTVK